MGADNADPFDALALAADTIPVALSASALDRCRGYVATLLLWRRRLSLTSAKTAREIVFDHVLDSLSVAPFIKPGYRVADIGSGAGFPGVPLAIACPDADFVLVESRRKKANFLRDVARRVDLANVEIAEKRAEELIGLLLPFDLVVSRALGPLRDFLGLATTLVKHGGLVIAMKGPKGRSETLAHADFTAAEVVEYQLPGGARHFLFTYQRR